MNPFDALIEKKPVEQRREWITRYRARVLDVLGDRVKIIPATTHCPETGLRQIHTPTFALLARFTNAPGGYRLLEDA